MMRQAQVNLQAVRFRYWPICKAAKNVMLVKMPVAPVILIQQHAEIAGSVGLVVQNAGRVTQTPLFFRLLGK